MKYLEVAIIGKGIPRVDPYRCELDDLGVEYSNAHIPNDEEGRPLYPTAIVLVPDREEKLPVEAALITKEAAVTKVEQREPSLAIAFSEAASKEASK